MKFECEIQEDRVLYVEGLDRGNKSSAQQVFDFAVQLFSSDLEVWSFCYINNGSSGP